MLKKQIIIPGTSIKFTFPAYIMGVEISIQEWPKPYEDTNYYNELRITLRRKDFFYAKNVVVFINRDSRKDYGEEFIQHLKQMILACLSEFLKEMFKEIWEGVINDN